MAFGRLRRIWEKIKGGIKSVWHKIVKPAIGKLAPIAGGAVGGAFGGPGGAAVGSAIGGAVGNVFSGAGIQSVGENGKRKGKVPDWLANA
jgi:hypothetical protein